MMDIWYCIYYIIKLYTYMDGGSENDGSQSHHGFKYSNEDARKCFLCLKLSISEILNESWAIASISLWYSLSLFVFIQWWNKWSQAESLQLVLMATVHGGSSTLLFYQDEPLESLKLFAAEPANSLGKTINMFRFCLRIFHRIATSWGFISVIWIYLNINTELIFKMYR